MKRKLSMLLILLLMVAAVWCSQQSASDKVIAKVNGDPITQAEFDARYGLVKSNYEAQSNAKLDEVKDKAAIQKLKDLTYNNLVSQKLLQQDAVKKKITVTDAEVKNSLDYIKSIKNQGNKDGYQQFLKENNLTEKTLTSELKISQLTSKVGDQITKNVTVSDAESKAYFEKNKTQFEQAGGVQIFHILVDKEATAKEVLQKLKAGGDFSSLAKEYSKDTSKDSGGYVGLANQDSQWVTEFKKAALSLKPGELYPDPVKSQFGYHIIKAGTQQAAVSKNYEDVKDQVKKAALQEKQNEVFQKYLTNLQSKAKIEDLRK